MLFSSSNCFSRTPSRWKNWDLKQPKTPPTTSRDTTPRHLHSPAFKKTTVQWTEPLTPSIWPTLHRKLKRRRLRNSGTYWVLRELRHPQRGSYLSLHWSNRARKNSDSLFRPATPTNNSRLSEKRLAGRIKLAKGAALSLPTHQRGSLPGISEHNQLNEKTKIVKAEMRKLQKKSTLNLK